MGPPTCRVQHSLNPSYGMHEEDSEKMQWRGELCKLWKWLLCRACTTSRQLDREFSLDYPDPAASSHIVRWITPWCPAMVHSTLMCNPPTPFHEKKWRRLVPVPEPIHTQYDTVQFVYNSMYILICMYYTVWYCRYCILYVISNEERWFLLGSPLTCWHLIQAIDVMRRIRNL